MNCVKLTQHKWSRKSRTPAQKRSPPPPKAAHAPTGRIIPMSASQSSHIFTNLNSSFERKSNNNSNKHEINEYLSNLQIKKPKKGQHVYKTLDMLHPSPTLFTNLNSSFERNSNQYYIKSFTIFWCR